jgi:hypothetical protein
MQTISIFSAEREAGLEAQIQEKTSIAYACPLAKYDDSNLQLLDLAIRDATNSFQARAGKDDNDLYRVTSILVSTNWNRNDDIFDTEEVWVARHTPSHKQTNIEHDDDKIVGHIIGNWAIDESRALIQDDIAVDNLPDVYHLLTTSVIYRHRQNPETQAQVYELISAIEQGKKFVSMECIFHGFDYGAIGPDGQKYVIKRTAESAFLTSHLRAYGGPGVYDDFKIGRVLRKITFSGKGFVDKPANPDSIIFDKSDLNLSNASNANPFSEDGVYILAAKLKQTENNTNEERKSMADDLKLLEGQLSDLKASLKDLQTENANLKDELSQANVKDLQVQVETLSAEKTQLETDLASVKEEFDKTKADLTKSNEQITEVTNKNTELTAKLDELKADIVRANRVASLVDGGFDKKTAETKVDLYKSLNNEQFTDIATELITARKALEAKCDEDKEKDKEKEKAEDTNDSQAEDDTSEAEDKEVITSAETQDDADLSTAAEDVDEEFETTRANLLSWVQQSVFNQDIEEESK